MNLVKLIGVCNLFENSPGLLQHEPSLADIRQVAVQLFHKMSLVIRQRESSKLSEADDNSKKVALSRAQDLLESVSYTVWKN